MHQSSNTTIHNLYNRVTSKLDAVGTWFPQLTLRLLLAWEFGESGFEKFHGTNWFADINFPFPFNILPPDITWGIATYFEIIGAFAIAFGFATRFFATSLFILTIVAIGSVHWPEHWNTLGELIKGYRIIDEEGDGFGNYKLPLIYMVMFLPLIFSGAGKLSVDHYLGKFCKIKHP